MKWHSQSKPIRFFLVRYLKVTETGVEYRETAVMGGKRKFFFADIEAILFSSDHTLSFQVAHEVFSIPIKPSKAKHRTAMAQLVAAVAGAHERSVGFPVVSPNM